MGTKIDYSGQIRRQLIQEVRDGKYKDRDRLPRETELAKEFGISRTHLRDILAQLEREGFITRRHGVGTLINRHVFQVKNRMDIETEFLEIIRQNGYCSGVKRVEFWEEKAGKHVAEKLQIPEGTEVLHVSRICTANGKPAIYCEDVLEKRLIQKAFQKEDLEPPIFHFLKSHCGVDAYLDLTQIRAVAADDVVAKALEIPVGTPVLNMEEVDYNLDGTIVFYSSEYFVNEFFEHTVLRKKL